MADIKITDEELDRLYEREAAPSDLDAMYRDAYAAGQPETELVQQEQHPDITLWDRFKIKNFGGSDQKAIQYLKAKHPDTTFDMRQGQIVARRKGEPLWQVLDPKTTEWADILVDPLWDIAAGVGTGIASATAGLAAAPTGLGALPASSAAGGAAAGALELGRQGIGNALGVNEGVDLGAAGIAATGGAVAPWLFGTGASTAAQTAKMMSPEGTQYIAALLKSIGREAVDPTSLEGITLAKEALAQSQRSGVQYAPGFFGSASGVGKDTINLAAGKAPKVFRGLTPDIPEPTGMDIANKLQSNNDFMFGKMVVKDTKEKLLEAKKSLQSYINSALDKSPVKMDVSEYAQPLKDRIDELERFAAEGGLTGDQELQLKLLKKDLQDKFFVKKTDIVPDENGEMVEVTRFIPKGVVSGKEAMNIKQSLKKLTSIFRTFEGAPVQDQNVMAAGNEIYAAYSNALDNVIAAADGAGPPGELLGKYKDIKVIERELLPIFDSRITTEKYFNSLDNKGRMGYKKAAYEIDAKYGTHLVDAADMVNLKNTFGKPSWNPVSSGGTTSTSRSLDTQAIGNAVGGVTGNVLGGAPGREIGRATGKIAMGKAMSAGAIKKFLEASQGSQKFKDVFTKLGQAPADITQEQLNKLSTGVGPQAVYMNQGLYPPTSYNLGLNSTWNLMRNEGK